ncbi:MAG: 3-phosphoshikimate 1-carboxyvinyltransferase, partial [Flavobacteriales bacterium]
DSGYLPLRIHGPMNDQDITVDGSVSSQFISGLLIAMSAHHSTRRLVVHGLTSLPYIELTLNLLQQFGVRWIQRTEGVFVKEEGSLSATQIHVPCDWSSAATMMVAAALCANDKIELLGLDRNSLHADKAALQLLAAAGVRSEWTSHDMSLIIYRSKPRSFQFDFGDCPDLVPVAMVLASASNGECKFFNTSRLRFKESHRGLAMQEELGKAGITTKVLENEIIVQPGVGQAGCFSSHADHRIAMAMTLFAMAHQGGVVEPVDCVDKSYSQFFDYLTLLGAKVQVEK